jgi:hypothetical protein
MTPEINKHYQHRYGGIYKVQDVSLSTVDKSQWIVYKHVYPFEQHTWHRPYEEFTDGRFTEISTDDLMYFCAKDRDKFREEITQAKSKKDK